LIDVNNEHLVAIPDKNRATAAGWEYGANMYLNDRFVHHLTVLMEGRKTSCSQQREVFGRESRKWLFPASARDPRLPPIPICRTEPARDLLLVFFESTLHVSPDQQLSALQPLTK